MSGEGTPKTTNVLTMQWILDPESNGAAAVREYLAACREIMPAAVPTVFGTTEPVRDRLAEVGDEPFSDACLAALTHWRTSNPFQWGHANLSEDDGRVRSVRLEVGSEFLEDPAGEQAIRHLFVDIADRLGCFYADIDVARGAKGTGRPTTTNPSATWGRRWRGLPLGDVWLAYFGPDYADVVSEQLRLEPTARGGHIYEFADAWRGPDRRPDATFHGVLPAGLLFGLGTTLLSKQPLTRDQMHSGLGPRPAKTIPQRLRHLAGLADPAT